ncbi:phage head closure protein [Bacillus seohaeanensis]|uniref:Phage head closure protein n=1 Tax=Bacillus seohaeanensis TaxID=284580 RepID=A0ABW5RRW0_9BACI
MKVGQLRERITFQNPPDPDAVNENGFPLTDYTDYKVNVPCAIKTLKGKEYQQANTTKNEITERFITRYSGGKGVSHDMRIKFSKNGVTRYFGIESIINEDEKNIWLTFVAKEVI